MIPDSKENQEVDLEILKCKEAIRILKEEIKQLSEEPKDKKATQKFQQTQPEIPDQPIREMGNFKPEASMLPLSKREI